MDTAATASAATSEALQGRLTALLHDTVSPKVTFGRVLLLLRSALPGVTGGSVWLARPGESEQLVAGDVQPDTAGGPAHALHTVPIEDESGVYGRLVLQLPPATVLAPSDSAVAAWVARSLVPAARIALGLDVPQTPRPAARS